jgi:CheY-like chemotaxis protein
LTQTAGPAGVSPSGRLAISGYGDEEARRRTKEAGFDHHLVKPIDYDALLSLLHPQAGV